MIQNKKRVCSLLEAKSPVLETYFEFYNVQIVLVIDLVSVIEMRLIGFEVI